jgi:enamine deaminase RidA (YjgF/YER057c/UK114 family)
MRKVLAPAGVAQPSFAYSHGLLVSNPSEFARLAGQIGAGPDGALAAGATAQAEQAWDNIEAILAEAGMTLADIAKVVSYVHSSDVAAYAAVHERRIGQIAPPWTLVPLPRFSSDAILVEIDVEAMR